MLLSLWIILRYQHYFNNNNNFFKKCFIILQIIKTNKLVSLWNNLIFVNLTQIIYLPSFNQFYYNSITYDKKK